MNIPFHGRYFCLKEEFSVNFIKFWNDYPESIPGPSYQIKIACETCENIKN